jgi:hypothetical protein
MIAEINVTGRDNKAAFFKKWLHKQIFIQNIIIRAHFLQEIAIPT